MKTFRVYLKDNREIDVVADHFTYDVSSGYVVFYKSKDEQDTDITIALGQAVAIVPAPVTQQPESQGVNDVDEFR
jgi:hypothetical protein